jgi:hypothetical protein
MGLRSLFRQNHKWTLAAISETKMEGVEKMKKKIKKIKAWLDVNEDGDLTIDDLQILVVRHEWMFVAGVFISVGSLANVLGYAEINSDWFWFFAGIAAMLEYVDDIRRRKFR